MEPPTIEAVGLVKHYGAVKALDGLDLTVDEGTVLGLLGPNGAGKTTTVRVLATLLKPDAGRATVAGFDVVRDAQKLRSVIGLSGQYAAVDENLTGFENLYLFGRLYQLPKAEARSRAEGLLEQFALSAAAGRTAKTYSGGMRRRLDLASALIGRPRLLFLDEPTTGLDPRSRLGMWEVIRDLVREGATLLLTTQYLEEADALADVIAVVDEGRIIARGTADELKAQVGGERIEVVVRRAEDVPSAVALVSGDGGEADVDQHTRRITVPARGGAQRLVQVVRDLDERGIAIDDIGLRRPTLDDVFLSLTGHAAELDPAPSDDADENPDSGEDLMVTVAQTEATQRRSMPPAVTDALVVTWRNLKRIPRIPELAIFAILQSIMFVLLFAFVFGGAIPIPGGGNYREYLMPGIFVQTLTFAAVTTAIGMAEDMHKGIIDRFRSLPMARSAVLAGRTTSDLVYNAGILVVLMVSGLAVGWRVHTGLGDFLAAVLLLLGFAYAMAWVGVFMGMSVPTVEVAQQLGFIVLFPMTFLSNAFVPTQSMPSWLQPIAEWNPISSIVSACRDLFGNPNPFAGGSFPSDHAFLMSTVWIVGALVVFAPLGVRRYRQASSR